MIVLDDSLGPLLHFGLWGECLPWTVEIAMIECALVLHGLRESVWKLVVSTSLREWFS